MLKKRANSILLLAISFLSANVFSGTTAGPEDVHLLYTRGSDGLFGVYAEDGSWHSNENCDDNSRVVIDPGLSEQVRSEFVSIILSQKVAERPMSFYLNGCVEWNGISHPKIIGIYVY